jgi:DNA polymerase III alpha subunit (gram-positive type)
MNLAPPPDRFQRTHPARWAAIDFETTGIWSRDPSTGVIEAAAVIYEGSREVSAWSTLVHPETRLSQFIMDLTKITPEMIDAAGVDRGVARQQMSDALHGVELVVAHNMSFDAEGLRWLGLFVPASKRYCTMEALVPPTEKWPKLSEAVSELGILVEGQPHRAETDARTAGRIFIEMVRRGY